MRFLRNIKIHPRWPLSAMLLFTAVLGSILGQRQDTVPNQEIVLQFSNENISLIEAQHTITIVEQELQRAGIDDIYVSEQEDGKLTISYYSKTTVEQIKKILIARKELALGLVSNEKNNLPVKFPVKENSFSYNLDVYEIHDGQNSISDLGGKSAVELKSGQFRFLNPNFYIPTDKTELTKELQLLEVDFTFQRYIAIAKDYRSHQIPEVRAGPLS